MPPRDNNIKSIHIPLKLFFILAFSILTCEFLIMLSLRSLPPMTLLNEAFVDTTLLTVLILPILYFFSYRPLLEELNRRKKMEEVLRTMALFDELTGLYNRRGFYSFAAQLLKLADRTKRKLTLIFADLDGLKTINDRYGHTVGDKVLACVAEVLKNTFRGSDIIGRLGGDEFAILALEASQEKIDLLRSRLVKTLAEADCKKQFACSVDLSFGIVHYDPEKPCGIENLIGNADLIMYQEKKNHKNG